MRVGNGLVSQLLRKTAVWLAITAALLFVPAGTIYWPEAWVFLAEIGIVGLASGLVIAKHDPALLRERMGPMMQKDQKGWDKVLLPVFFVLWLGQYVVSGLDAVRFEISQVPLWLKVVGALGIAIGFYVVHIVMRTNTFAAPVVKIQSERKHQVISTGPYAYVRHPMYGGAILLALGTPLLLGSWYGVALGIMSIVVLALRAVLEEETLKSELEGYDAYAASVPYRLVPGVW
jgi:protein-S-isoprenylcysteine O-methyltransferase Ste14